MREDYWVKDRELVERQNTYILRTKVNRRIFDGVQEYYYDEFSCQWKEHDE